MNSAEQIKLSELRGSSKKITTRKLVSKKLSSTLSVDRKDRAPTQKSGFSNSSPPPPEIRKQHNLDIAAIQE